MPSRVWYLMGLIAVTAAQGGSPSPFDWKAAARSISAELSSPSFLPYTKPNQKIEEFIALGDSYTAGTGCNGNQERFAGGAVRGQRSYPMQMFADSESWEFINGDKAIPRFSFPAYTGDTSVELVAEQLKLGDYKENNRNLDRAQPFGKPQLAVVTIGGNDATLSAVLSACIFRHWLPKDCQQTIANVQRDIDDGTLRDKINYALYKVAHTGRESAGTNPRESFQVFVLRYVTFFNEETTPCDNLSWGYWWWDQPKLTRQLRKRLNDLNRSVHEQLKLAIKDLEIMGVILVDGLDELYDGHRYCEDRHTSYEMVDYDTWFWSPFAQFNTPSEGPGDSDNPYVSSIEDPAKLLLDFVFPGQNIDPKSISKDSPPWTWKGAENYPSDEALLDAIQRNVTTNAFAPFNYLRSFHPKATAHGHHKTEVFTSIIANRQIAASTFDIYTHRCTDWDIKSDHLLVATCTDKQGNRVRSQAAIEQCLRYDDGALIPAADGQYTKNCHGCFFNKGSDELWCICKNDQDSNAKSASVQLDKFMSVRNDGYVTCFGHNSTATSLRRWEWMS